ncbi:MAG: hypothetical protein H7321_04490 [Bacteroidia bacterium]|nr:hypothetical protein [Bacteroidia bacterium]
MTERSLSMTAEFLSFSPQERPHYTQNYISLLEFESLTTEMQTIIKRKKETEKVNISNNNISLAVT